MLNKLDWLTGDLTTTDGDSLYGSTGGQLTVFGPFLLDNPIDIFEFTWTADDNAAGGDVSFMTNTTDMVLWIGADMENANAVIDIPTTEAAFGWTVVPAPWTLGLIGLGLATLRRRKSDWQEVRV